MMKSEGVADEMVMLLAGWSTTQMLQRYGRSAATERARVQQRQWSPGGGLLTQEAPSRMAVWRQPALAAFLVSDRGLSRGHFHAHEMAEFGLRHPPRRIEDPQSGHL